MDYRKLLKEENEAVTERYDLVMGRIAGLPQEQQVSEPFRAYFSKTAAFITRLGELYESFDQGLDLTALSLEQLQALNLELYADILPQNYETSYGNPAYAVQMLGDEYGQLLSFLYTEVRGMIVYAYEGRKADLTTVAELFMEIYGYFEDESKPSYQELQQVIYWYISDYADVTIEESLAEQFDDNRSFLKDILCTADLSDERYLYLYGEYVSDNELQTARYLSSLQQEEIDLMADTFVNGFTRGYQTMRMNLSVKNNVCIRAYMGFERVLRVAIQKFEAKGLTVHLFRSPVASINKKSVRVGFLGTSTNPQYDYDHAQDAALYLDKALVERRLEVLKTAYENRKKTVAAYAGPACQEVFGEEPFSPKMKPEVLKLSEKQRELSVSYANRSAALTAEYIDQNNTSFTIISYPIPEIGKDYEAIFGETIRINTLDNDTYLRIQQTIIDVLDHATYVRVRGTARKNETDMLVVLHPLQDPQKETKFENCAADVNIPAGEVFTSPMLKGTSGILHVSSVYLNGYHFSNLRIRIRNGMVTDYSCENFKTQEENRRYIKENILKNHDTLPIGEFAIGTNTVAYCMAKKYGIMEKLPILIVEKMGPHFALGDTCYSRSEDHKVYNPDGKEIIARENEVSALRKSEPEKAYYNCHTDITIPYDEIGFINAVVENGKEVSIIRDGRFVLPGTEEFNHPFEEENFNF